VFVRCCGGKSKSEDGPSLSRNFLELRGSLQNQNARTRRNTRLIKLKRASRAQFASLFNMDRPTVHDLHSDDHFVQVAKKNWLKKPNPAKFKAQTLKKEIWDALEQTDFPLRSLLILENEQFLERYAKLLLRALTAQVSLAQL
jgi:hypothetical protein